MFCRKQMPTPNNYGNFCVLVTATSVRNKAEEAIVRYTTAYPFRPSGTIDMLCPYCKSRFDDGHLYRQHMEDEDHAKADTKLAFAHIRGSESEYYGKVDITVMKCRICHVKFDKINLIAEHLLDTHDIDIVPSAINLQPCKIENKNFICALCDATFFNLLHLGKHFGSHYIKYTCDVCGRGFTNVGTVKRHKLVTHSKKKFCCQKCLQFFDTTEEKRQHMDDSPKCWVYCCTLCPERFKTYMLRMQHLQNIHGQSPKTFVCRCGEKFECSRAYSTHNKKHHDFSKHCCSYCGMKCITKGELEEHLVVHTKKQEFPCTVCHKVFFRKKSLVQHMWIHSEVKRFVCKLCDKTFNQKVCYKRHMKTHHPGVEYA